MHEIFYHAMNYTSKGTVDAASGGAFKRKTAKEATQLIEELAKSNYRAPSEASRSSSSVTPKILGVPFLFFLFTSNLQRAI